MDRIHGMTLIEYADELAREIHDEHPDWSYVQCSAAAEWRVEREKSE